MIAKLVSILSIIGSLSIGLRADYRLVFEDNFDQNSLNKSNWKFETGGEPQWGNHELQYYTESSENVRLTDGNLVIEAKPREEGGKHFTSGRLNSRHAWTYGKFEARARLPKGKNLWPAIWMMPLEDTYGDWPASGEIDIMESRGEKSDTIECTAHFGGAFPDNIFAGSPEMKFEDLSRDFHVFGLEWDEKELKWTLDGKEVFKTSIDKSLWSKKGKNPYNKNGQPFDKPFYWVMNVAVGGDFFPEDEYGKPVTAEEAKKWSKPTMEFDYIRVYQKI